MAGVPSNALSWAELSQASNDEKKRPAEMEVLSGASDAYSRNPAHSNCRPEHE